jgi:hypothetical protein
VGRNVDQWAESKKNKWDPVTSHSSTLKLEELVSSELFVNIYKSRWRDCCIFSVGSLLGLLFGLQSGSMTFIQKCR